MHEKILYFKKTEKDVTLPNNKVMHNQKSRRFKKSKEKLDLEAYRETEMTWDLHRYESEVLELECSMYMPQEVFSNTLSEKEVLNHLCSSLFFDFEYSPIEKDRLYIRYTYKIPDSRNKYRDPLDEYMLFEYGKGKWELGSVLNSYHSAEIASGILEMQE